MNQNRYINKYLFTRDKKILNLITAKENRKWFIFWYSD